jgi:hypothetical protein
VAPGFAPETGSEEAAPNASATTTTERPIELGLDGTVLRQELWSHHDDGPPVHEAPERIRPSIGLLSEGLAQMAAEKGVSRSSAAVSAAYVAAREGAPAEGIALFDVRADATGAVVSVTPVSGADAERWRAVAERMRTLLAGQRLRVPSGAAGMLTRLRIERGDVAKKPSELGKLERGPAMGQEGPLHPRQVAVESTQKSLENGQLTPTWMVHSSARNARTMRVVIVSERLL